MNALFSYLTFNGNCREAMEFYQMCLGGKLFFQTLEDVPGGENAPADLKRSIVHASLENGPISLMGSDMVGEDGFLNGNSISILLASPFEMELRKYFEGLSYRGREILPLNATFTGNLFGGLTDQFGTHWLFLCRR